MATTNIIRIGHFQKTKQVLSPSAEAKYCIWPQDMEAHSIQLFMFGSTADLK